MHVPFYVITQKILTVVIVNGDLDRLVLDDGQSGSDLLKLGGGLGIARVVVEDREEVAVSRVHNCGQGVLWNV